MTQETAAVRPLTDAMTGVMIAAHERDGMVEVYDYSASAIRGLEARGLVRTGYAVLRHTKGRERKVAELTKAGEALIKSWGI